MKHLLFIAILLSCTLYTILLITFSSGIALNIVARSVPAQEFSVSISEYKTIKNVHLIDSRSLSEYKISHIKGSEWIGSSIPEWESAEIDCEDTVVVYCSVGYRSGKAVEYFRSKGCDNILNLKTGIFGWINEGNAVYLMSGEEVNTIHPFNTYWGLLITDSKFIKKAE